MNQQNTDGTPPPLGLMKLARLKGPEAQPGDVASPPQLSSPAPPLPVVPNLLPPPGGLKRFAPQEQRVLLELARLALINAVLRLTPPQITPESLPPGLTEKRPCFVTLMKAGALRGCIGQITSEEPLYQALLRNARNAALRDPRFPPVEPQELEQIRLELSVLTEPQPLLFSSPEELLSKLQPHRDGVLLRLGGRQATFLPQVWEQVPDKIAFLNLLAQKAGCRPGGWRDKEARISVYQVDSFAETEPDLSGG